MSMINWAFFRLLSYRLFAVASVISFHIKNNKAHRSKMGLSVS